MSLQVKLDFIRRTAVMINSNGAGNTWPTEEFTFVTLQKSLHVHGDGGWEACQRAIRRSVACVA
jgi:hypothetical protein